MFDIYLNYCEEIFGGSHKFTKNGLDYDVLNIHNNWDDFKLYSRIKCDLENILYFIVLMELDLMVLMSGMSN